MASIMQDPLSGRYFIRFRYAGESFKRSLSTCSLHEAEAALSRVNETLKHIKRGRLQVPEDADPALFVLSDGRVEKKPEIPVFRHSFASNAALAGALEPIVNHWMGHVLPSRIYRWLRPFGILRIPNILFHVHC